MDEVSRTKPQNKPPDATATGSASGGNTDFTTEASLLMLPPVAGFAILETLGEGGMGIVYKARELELGRIVALKMIHGGRGASTTELLRFQQEAQAVAAIEHPNVVRVFSCGDADGRPYLAMEYLGGGSLAERLRNEKRLNQRVAVELVRKVALAIQAAHDQHIVHRDLKPANILFDAHGEPKVTDFGLAKTADGGLTATNAIMGTAAFMAPEQARGESKFVGPQADVWALGVMLFECLTGARPFTGAHNLEILQNVIAKEPDTLRRHMPGLSPDLQVIVQKCLQKDLTKRYGNAAEVAGDLQRWLNGEPLRAALTDSWQIRFESTGLTLPLSSGGKVLEGLHTGEWDMTDEVRGPDDADWRPIEDHPAFAESISELDAPRAEPPDETRLDMNPLIDVALVLLIFFILTTTYSTLRRSIDVPAEPDGKGKQENVVTANDLKNLAFNLTVWSDGDTFRVKLEDSILDMKDLEKLMIEQVRNSGKRQLILSVDGKVPWGVEALVYDAAKAAEVTQIYRKKYKPQP